MQKIAVLIPCYNEEKTIEVVVADFRTALPDAAVYVFDNNSSDRTAEIAEGAGARVFHEVRQGKGNVVRTMFRVVDADVYLLVDGDSTYSAQDARKLIEPILGGRADMVVGDRISSRAYQNENKRPFHSFGNWLVCWLVKRLFKVRLSDIMSGYRSFNALFVKTVPILSEGFEIETEMSLHALDKRFRILEVPISYSDRPAGSLSKLKTFADGFRVLKTIAFVFKNYKPMTFFGWTSFFVALSGLAIGIFPIIEYVRYSYVYKVPSAVLASALEILAMLFFCCGLILETTVRQHKETFEIYLNSVVAKRVKAKDS